MATISGGTTAAGATDTGARAAFFRVFNLKNVAVTLLFCMLLIVGRIIVTMYQEPIEALISAFARATRANMITGMMLLFGIAAAGVRTPPRSASRNAPRSASACWWRSH